MYEEVFAGVIYLLFIHIILGNTWNLKNGAILLIFRTQGALLFLNVCENCDPFLH